MRSIDRRVLLGGAVAGFAASGPTQDTSSHHTVGAFGGKRLDARDFGALGDRQHDDGPAIAAAIAAAAEHDQYPASVFLAAGHYHRRTTISLRNHLNLLGEGDSSVLNSQGDEDFNQPILANATADGLVHARLSDLALLGGSHGLKLQAAAENADIRLTNVAMDMQSVANIEADKLFQTVKITNCSFGRAPYGLKVNGYGTNLLMSVASEWIDHRDSSIYLRGTEAITFIGNRFEVGGLPQKICIDIEDANTVSFIGCWFEDVHEILARFRKITGQILFQSCHFTGTKLGGSTWRGFAWDVSDCRVAFRDCLSVAPMTVDGHVDLDGSVGIASSKAYISGSDRAGILTAVPRPFTTTPGPLLSIAPSNSKTWSVIGQLSVAVLADNGAIVWRGETGDIVLQSGGAAHVVADTAELRITTQRADEGKIMLDARFKTPAQGSRLWWRFAWSAIDGGATVRAL